MLMIMMMVVVMVMGVYVERKQYAYLGKWAGRMGRDGIE